MKGGVAASLSRAHLERRCDELERRVAEQARTLAQASEALTAELASHEETRAALLNAQKLDAMRHLTANFLHESKNALQAVGACFQLVSAAPLNAEHRETLLVGKSAVDLVVKLTRRFMSQIGLRAPRIERIDPREWLPQFAELARLSLGSGTALDIRVEDDLPHITLDPTELQSALLNLVLNARDAVTDGGIVTISARRGAAERDANDRLLPVLVFAVEDTGCGMPQDVLERAGEPFFTTKAAQNGTGLGLAAVNAFVARAGGWMDIDSTLTVGTSIKLHLPASTGPSPKPQSASRSGSSKCQILLIAPLGAVRTSTALALRSLNYCVIEAACVNTAVALSYQIPALHLGIVSSAVGDVRGVIDRLRSERPSLPFLVLAYHGDTESAADFPTLIHPFDHSQLAAAVASTGCPA